MKMIPTPPSGKEVAYRICSRLLMMNPLMMSQYYTNLFNAFRSLIYMMGDEENFNQLNKKIADIENWLSDDYNQMTIQEAEIRMWTNMDLLSGFEVNGEMITQMQINYRLEEIKQYLLQLSFEYMSYIRWTINLQQMV